MKKSVLIVVLISSFLIIKSLMIHAQIYFPPVSQYPYPISPWVQWPPYMWGGWSPWSTVYNPYTQFQSIPDYGWYTPWNVNLPYYYDRPLPWNQAFDAIFAGIGFLPPYGWNPASGIDLLEYLGYFVPLVPPDRLLFPKAYTQDFINFYPGFPPLKIRALQDLLCDTLI